MEISDKYDLHYKTFKLPNGIKCVLYPRNEVHSVTIEVTANVGALDEDEKTNGIAHFLEHVVHDSTRDFPTWKDIDNFTNEYSGSTNAFTSLEITQFYGTFPFQYLDEALYFFSQITLHPSIKEEDVSKEREIILDEKQRYEDDVDHKQLLNIKDNRFASLNSPYSYEIIGQRELLKKFTQKDIQDFYQKYYSPANLEVYIVGNFEIEKAKELLLKHFNIDRKSSEIVRKYKDTYPEYSGFKINALRKDDINQYYLTVNFPSSEFKLTTIEERFTLDFLKSITASSQYFQSILWQRLREELGIVYGVSASTYDMYARSSFIISTSFDKQHLETVLTEVYKGLELVKSGKVGKNIFEARKKRLMDTMLMQLDKPERTLDWISNYEDEVIEHGRAFTISEYLEFIDQLEFEEVIKLAHKIFDWEKVNIGLVTRDEGKEVEEKVSEIWSQITN
jgi:zinc protease